MCGQAEIENFAMIYFFITKFAENDLHCLKKYENKNKFFY